MGASNCFDLCTTAATLHYIPPTPHAHTHAQMVPLYTHPHITLMVQGQKEWNEREEKKTQILYTNIKSRFRTINP